MKNIHVLQTNKPSKLAFDLDENFYLTSEEPQFFEFQNLVQNRELYITSDEEIKEGDWVICSMSNKPTKALQNEDYSSKNDWRKIILTTDGDLIKEGVQSIDDEFLNWFVQNPSCEEIGVLTNNMKNADYIEVAERLYKYINPTSKMDCPNSVYITTEKWYYEWLNIETDLDLFDWCVKFKNK